MEEPEGTGGGGGGPRGPSILVRAALHAAFFISGFTALTFEVLWERELRLVFGVSTYSVAIVTSAFMAGLALGYALGRHPRLAERSPLRIYALAEIAVALYAAAFPLLIGGIDVIHRATGGSLFAQTVLALLLLLPPTIAMGVTLPVVTRALAAATTAGRAAAGLFAANTAGGVAGTLATSWFLVRWFGASSTGLIAVALNLALGALAFALASRLAAPRPPAGAEDVAAAPGASQGVGRPILVAAFLAGVQTMGLQIVWNRTLICVVENNTTSFALILAAVLIGSAIGAWLYRPTLRLVGNERSRLLALFVAAEVVLALWVVGSISLLNRLYEITDALSAAVTISTPLVLMLVRLVVALLPVLPAAAAGAFLLPLLTDLDEGTDGDAARPVSRVFSVDAVGSVVGGLGGGFLLMPLFGLEMSLVLLALVGLVTAALVLASDARAGSIRGIGLTTIAAAVLAAFVLREPLTLTRWYDGHQKIRGEMLLYEEGAFGTISVFNVEGRKELLINCIEEVPNHRDAMLLFKLLGHTPVLMHGAAERILVNAIGGGITLGSVLHHGVPVDAVELVPEVKKAMAIFAEENDDALGKKHWRMIHDDGRNWLQLAPEPYDVVTADATHPAAGESWPLYTREYYELVRSHLTPRGVFAQWLPMHNMANSDFLSVLKTFREVFPNLLVLFVNRYCVVLASQEPLETDAATLSERIAAKPDVAEDLAEFGIVRGEDLLKYVVMDTATVDRVAADAELLTDDYAAVEFAELHRLGLAETFVSNLALLARSMDPQALSQATGAPLELFRARSLLIGAQLRSREPTIESAFAALADLQRAKSEWPRDEDVDYATAMLEGTIQRFLTSSYEEFLERPDFERFVEPLVGLARAHPDSSFLQQVAGTAYLRLERFADALPFLEAAAQTRPDDPNFLSNLAFTYDRLERYEEALRTIEHLSGLMPGNAALDKFKAEVERRRDERGAAP